MTPEETRARDEADRLIDGLRDFTNHDPIATVSILSHAAISVALHSGFTKEGYLHSTGLVWDRMQKAAAVQ